MKKLLGWVLVLTCPFLFITKALLLALHGNTLAVSFLSVLVLLGCTLGGLYLLEVGDTK